VEPETQRLLQHWRSHKFSGVRPFFCQVEAVETLIWVTEVAPKIGKTGKRFLEHPMIIAWQTVNAVRRPGSGRFSRGFLGSRSA